jgi:hypothetical protein
VTVAANSALAPASTRAEPGCTVTATDWPLGLAPEGGPPHASTATASAARDITCPAGLMTGSS